VYVGYTWPYPLPSPGFPHKDVPEVHPGEGKSTEHGGTQQNASESGSVPRMFWCTDQHITILTCVGVRRGHLLAETTNRGRTEFARKGAESTSRRSTGPLQHCMRWCGRLVSLCYTHYAGHYAAIAVLHQAAQSALHT